MNDGGWQKRWWLGAIAGLTLANALTADDFRFWKTSEGRQSDVKLKVVTQLEDRVRLQREDTGRVVELPIERLSDEDRNYLRQLRSTTAAGSDFQPDDAGYRQLIAPFFAQHCQKCHSGSSPEADFRVDEQLTANFLDRTTTEQWSEILNQLNSGTMPPADEPRPASAEVSRVVSWIERERLRGEKARRDGSVVLRRMNREEYNHTIRDLIGIDFQIVDDFPEDPPAGGFDNNGRALTISPMHLELYLKTAQKILDRVIVDVANKPTTVQWRFELENGRAGSPTRRVRLDEDRNRNVHILCGERPTRDGMVVLRHTGEPWTGIQHFTVPYEGEYIIRIRAAGLTPPEESARQAGPMFQVRRQEERESKITDDAERRKSRENFDQFTIPYVTKHFQEDRSYRFGPPRLKVLGILGSRRPVLAEFDVEAPPDAPRVYEIRTRLNVEDSGLNLSNQYRIPEHWYLGMNEQHDDFPRPELFLDWVEIEGPIYDAWPPTSHTRILIDSPSRGRDEIEYAREVLAHFMQRAWRRPLTAGEVEPLLALFQHVRPEKSSFEAAIQVPLTAVLTSPHFLYLVEEGSSPTLNRFELASRLSYFLWSSMPDEELLRHATTGAIREPEVLRDQVDRMLQDERHAAFVKNFTGQWLELRKVGANPPVQSIYTRYDRHLEVSMRGETEAFFAHVLHNDRSVLDFLDSDYITINERLARFYDIPGVKGDYFRPVPVPPGTPRGGLVTQASILSLTSNGTRTSPVWRGVWVLENLLGDPPPPPPPNAGDIPAGVPGLDKVTIRERLKLHREQPQCARCHDKIDPLGFALENFAASGEWREREAKMYMFPATNRNDPVIDASARLPDGTEFTGHDGLQQEMLRREDPFLRCLAQKLYTYALGREMAYADDPLLDDAVTYMREHGKTLRSLLHHIVTSSAFQSK